MKYIKKFSTLSAQTEYLANAEIDTYLGYVEGVGLQYDDVIPVAPQCEPTYDNDEWTSGEIYNWVASEMPPSSSHETATMTETICDGTDTSDAWESIGLDVNWFLKLIQFLQGGATLSLSATLDGNSVDVDVYYDDMGGSSYVRFTDDSGLNQIGYAGTQYDMDSGDYTFETYDFASGDWEWTLTYDDGGGNWDDAE